jgi:hypothetical protein
MADHHRALDPQLPHRPVQQRRLLHRGPHPAARALAMAEARAVDDDDPVPFQQPLGQAAGVVVLAADRVAVDQQNGLALAAVGVVQADAIHRDEAALGRMPALRPPGQHRIRHGKPGQGCAGGKQAAAGGEGSDGGE